MVFSMGWLTKRVLDLTLPFPTRLPTGGPIASVHIRDHLIFQTSIPIKTDLRQLYQSSVKQLISLTGRQ